MKAGLTRLNKEELITRVQELETRVKWFERMVFGSKRERFFPDPAEQTMLQLETLLPEKAPSQTEQITYSRNKVQAKQKPSRQFLPADLPRKEQIIRPQGDLTGAVKIGEVVTEILEYKKAAFWVRRIIREKYAWAEREDKGVVIGTLPQRPIDKGIAGSSLLAQLIVNKFVDHLPLYRQIERFKRSGIELSRSSLSGWMSQCAKLLTPLYHKMRQAVIEADYIQVDETSIRVQDKDKQGATHLGYHWIYQSVLENIVIFEYRRSRSREGPEQRLKTFKGFLQTDGYKVYDRFESGTYPEIQVLGCMAHARRYFYEAKDNHAKYAAQALGFFQQLYSVERHAREQKLCAEQRHLLRKEKALPVLQAFKCWLDKNQFATTPKSKIGKAIAYCNRRWEKLCNYTLDGKLEIDNNLAENSIRPIALGRKNYLFAGSHRAAQDAAIFYSCLATCKKHNVNVESWLTDVLDRIKDHKMNQLHQLFPGNWKTLD